MAIVDCAPLRDALYIHSRSYSNGGSDYSATELLNPPRIVQLTKRYKDKIGIESIEDPEELNEKIESQIASFIGTAIHAYIEKCLYKVRNIDNTYKYMLERRMFDRVSDRYISGQFDIYWPENEILYDVKTTSAWNMVFKPEEKRKSWEEQANIYSYLMNMPGKFKKTIPTKQAKILAIYTDWDKMKAKSSNGYPEHKFEEHTLNLWTRNAQKEFLENKINIQKQYEDVPDTDLPMCSKEDMWEKDSVYAVYKYNKKGSIGAKATRLFSDEQSALTYVSETLKGNGTIQFRPGERIRCSRFCDCAKYCNQYQEYLNEKK